MRPRRDATRGGCAGNDEDKGSGGVRACACAFACPCTCCVRCVCVDTCCVLGSPQLLATPGHHQCVYLYVYAGHDPDHRGEHGKNSWDVLKWDVLKSVGRKYEKGKLCVSVLRTVKSRRGKLVKYKAINELVRVGAITPMNWYAWGLPINTSSRPTTRTGPEKMRTARRVTSTRRASWTSTRARAFAILRTRQILWSVCLN